MRRVTLRHEKAPAVWSGPAEEALVRRIQRSLFGREQRYLCSHVDVVAQIVSLRHRRLSVRSFNRLLMLAPRYIWPTVIKPHNEFHGRHPLMVSTLQCRKSPGV